MLYPTELRGHIGDGNKPDSQLIVPLKGCQAGIQAMVWKVRKGIAHTSVKAQPQHAMKRSCTRLFWSTGVFPGYPAALQIFLGLKVVAK